MTFVITDACVDIKDQSCVTSCPVDCIYEGSRKLYIHPDECIDCGACEPICPVDAIYLDEETPEDQIGHIATAVDFFARLGKPGGATAAGPLDWDCLPEASSTSESG